ncbi:MAG: hypothetical protein VKK94_02765 [Cyanobacteriota bacterium]|nr:hypothetical protein [Cyanobacteriota bacterium]
MDLFAVLPTTRPAAGNRFASTASLPGQNSSSCHASGSGPTAAERVIAAELQGRGQSSDALSMMVSSMVRMVQVGRERDSRWNAS